MEYNKIFEDSKVNPKVPSEFYYIEVYSPSISTLLPHLLKTFIRKAGGENKYTEFETKQFAFYHGDALAIRYAIKKLDEYEFKAETTT